MFTNGFQILKSCLALESVELNFLFLIINIFVKSLNYHAIISAIPIIKQHPITSANIITINHLKVVVNFRSILINL